MNEFEEVMRAALAALERGETVALASVVQVHGSAPRHSGARMIVWPDGHITGTVGGATLEEKVILHAQEALSAHQSDSHRQHREFTCRMTGRPESWTACR